MTTPPMPAKLSPARSPSPRIPAWIIAWTLAFAGAARAEKPSGAPAPEAPARSNGARDPFMTGALGILPFISGFYLTESPEKGLVFTLVDVLLVLSVFNAREGRQQGEGNIPVYFGLMGLNNAVDAGLAIRHEMKRRLPVARLNLLPGKGLEGRIAWNF